MKNIALSIVFTIIMSAIVTIGCAKENTNEIVEATKQEQAATETYIDDRDITYNDNKTIGGDYVDDRDVQNNYYDYTEEHLYDKSYFDDDKINELEAQIEELKKEQLTTAEESEDVEENIDEEVEETEKTEETEESTDNEMEPNMVTCDHCGRQGELYENIAKWYSTDGYNNFTHPYCTEDYIKENGKEPVDDIPNLE